MHLTKIENEWKKKSRKFEWMNIFLFFSCVVDDVAVAMWNLFDPHAHAYRSTKEVLLPFFVAAEKCYLWFKAPAHILGDPLHHSQLSKSPENQIRCCQSLFVFTYWMHYMLQLSECGRGKKFGVIFSTLFETSILTALYSFDFFLLLLFTVCGARTLNFNFVLLPEGCLKMNNKTTVFEFKLILFDSILGFWSMVVDNFIDSVIEKEKEQKEKKRFG